MESEGPGSPPPPPAGDDLLEALKRTAADREHDRARRGLRRRQVAVAVTAGAVAAVAAIGISRGLARTHLRLPDRIGEFSRMHSVDLDSALQAAAKSGSVPAGGEVAASFYGTGTGEPDLLLVLVKGKHTDADAAAFRSEFEAPFESGHPSTPDGAHTRTASVGGVDFVCEPVIDNGANGPIGERTECVWDDHQDALGVLVDFHSGESEVVLHEAEQVQPTTLG